MAYELIPLPVGWSIEGRIGGRTPAATDYTIQTPAVALRVYGDNEYGDAVGPDGRDRDLNPNGVPYTDGQRITYRLVQGVPDHPIYVEIV